MSARRALLAVLPVVLGLGLAGVGAAAPAAAAPAPGGFTCTGDFSNLPNSAEMVPAGTYTSLTMPPATACFVGGDVVVNGPVTLGQASGLGLLSGSLTVNGKVTVGDGASLGDTGGGQPPISVNGPLFIDPNGLVFLLGPGTISGGVHASAPSGVTLFDLRIGGPVQILGGGGDNPVQDELGNTNYQSVYVGQNVISGPVTENGYAGAGDDGNGSFVGFDHTSGPMTLINNTVASILVQSNVINGPATCSGNNPLPQDLGSSTVTGPIKGSQGQQCFS
jgi:hypothetical protein